MWQHRRAARGQVAQQRVGVDVVEVKLLGRQPASEVQQIERVSPDRPRRVVPRRQVPQEVVDQADPSHRAGERPSVAGRFHPKLGSTGRHATAYTAPAGRRGQDGRCPATAVWRPPSKNRRSAQSCSIESGPATSCLGVSAISQTRARASAVEASCGRRIWEASKSRMDTGYPTCVYCGEVIGVY